MFTPNIKNEKRRGRARFTREENNIMRLKELG
jgi:hypothetical protein